MQAHTSIDDLLDRAVEAVNLGDRRTANALAGQVLAVDRANPDAEELLAAPGDHGEIRRLTLMFVDLVDSTALSTRIEPEVYRTVVGRYRNEVNRVVDHYEGHIDSTKGDGLLAVFGHPVAHENDAHRAIYAGIDIVRAVNELSQRVHRRFGFEISVRVGIHRGLVYLDTVDDDVYGLGANFAARVCSVADPGTVTISRTIKEIVCDTFELDELPPRDVKGVEGAIHTYRVAGERDVLIRVTGPLVGRDKELACLKRAWQHAKDGNLAKPGIAFHGEGGVGKTRLAYAAVEMAQQDGAVVLGMWGSPFHTDVGLRPVRRLLERRCGIKRENDPSERLYKLEAELAQRSLDTPSVISLLAPVIGVGAESGYEPNSADGSKLYGRIADAIQQYLHSCLGSGPALVLVEDLHWFDEDTLDVVDKLMKSAHARLLVVLTSRTLPPISDVATVLQVTPLDDSEADELVHALHPDLTTEARSAVRERCDGIPLYIEEVVTKLKEQSSDISETSLVPDTLYEALFARLRSVPNSLPVVGAAALIGSRFDRRLLSTVVDMDDREIIDVLDKLVRGRVLQPVANETWRFHHELLREVAAEVSPPSTRRRLHSRIADALVGAVDTSPEWQLAARHYESAERYEEAATAYERASADARRRGALNEARGHLGHALENILCEDRTPERDHREIEVRLESGHLASAAQGHSSREAAAEFERCLELIGSDPSPELYATLNALWIYYTARGDLRRSTQLAETLQRKGDVSPGAAAGVATTKGILAGFRGDYSTARELLEGAAAAAQETPAPESLAYYGPNDPVGGMYSFLAFVRFIQGDLRGAREALTSMEARSLAIGFPRGAFSLCYGRSIEALVHSESGQPDRCAELGAELIALAKQYDFDEWVMVGWSQQSSGQAMAALTAGETDHSVLRPHIETMATVVQTWRAFEVMTFLAMSDAILARLLIAVGDLEEARRCIDVSLAMGKDTWIQFYDAELMRLRAHTLDDRDAQHEQLRAAIALARTQGAHILELRAAIDDFELMGDPAREALLEAMTRLPNGQSVPELERARTLLA